jgi:hypothetical protein
LFSERLGKNENLKALMLVEILMNVFEFQRLACLERLKVGMAARL